MPPGGIAAPETCGPLVCSLFVTARFVTTSQRGRRPAAID